MTVIPEAGVTGLAWSMSAEPGRLARLRSPWRKPGASAGGSCIEAASTGTAVLIRDTKDRGGPVLAFTPRAWRDFTARQKTADQDRRASLGD